ncbi:MAG: acyl-CoA thioesterase II [Actinobacteria bacterium]|nr:acyl-CoA thioesterase II [Actinomycetota bacterium]
MSHDELEALEEVRRNHRGPTLEAVIDSLTLTPEGDGVYAAPSVGIGTGRIFGGQVLGQVLVAAAAAVPTKQVKSVYVQFARDGVAPDPVHIEVAVLHDGGTYATCDVRVHQEGRVLADATASLHVPGEGPEQQTAVLLDHDPEGAPLQDLHMIPCETRVVGDVLLRDEAVGPAEFSFWMREPGVAGQPLAVHQALVAFSSDLTPIATALRALPGMSQMSSHRTVQTATTSHTVWFHADFDLTDWVCFQQTAPVTGEGRSFGWGHVFTRDGRAVASYAQDAMVRWLKANPGRVARTTA